MHSDNETDKVVRTSEKLWLQILDLHKTGAPKSQSCITVVLIGPYQSLVSH